jgi:hypothetical protein
MEDVTGQETIAISILVIALTLGQVHAVAQMDIQQLFPGRCMPIVPGTGWYGYAYCELANPGRGRNRAGNPAA